jgi:hypothetical protein
MTSSSKSLIHGNFIPWDPLLHPSPVRLVPSTESWRPTGALHPPEARLPACWVEEAEFD